MNEFSFFSLLNAKCMKCQNNLYKVLLSDACERFDLPFPKGEKGNKTTIVCITCMEIYQDVLLSIGSEDMQVFDGMKEIKKKQTKENE